MTELTTQKIDEQTIGIALPKNKYENGEKVTVLRGSSLEFNIRWWGFGICMTVVGVILGIGIGMAL